MHIRRLILSTLAIAFGAFLIVYGEFDDSPGGQLLGAVLAIVGVISAIKIWKKKSN